ncbi:prolyl hydroxylase family protein [Litorimonas sp. RW-G-Af-16]|uniref:prolyl hydroxylase family protein n=1 Tax=Litorimonas sp. RW-G-Af-16 TaxID=3241168 RepID=UPI00390C5160
MKTEFSSDWKSWIKTNVDAGQDRDGIFKILLDEGYSFTAIEKEMNYKPTRDISEIKNPFTVAAEEDARLKAEGEDQTASAISANTFEGNNGAAIAPSQIFVPNAKTINASKIDLRTVDNFLTPEECASIIARIKPKLRPSQVSDFQVDSNVRTSQTCDLGRLDDPFIEDIDERICKLIGINKAYSEVIQGQYYQVGQEFKAHTDFFDLHEVETHCQVFGQRTYTVMIYLNDVEDGGETCFKRIGAEFKPVMGKAVIWNSLNPDGTPNMNSLHQANPVKQGYKAVITKWFRSTCPSQADTNMLTKGKNERVPNYTPSGIAKINMPEDVFEKVSQFYHENRANLVDEHVQGGFITGGNAMTVQRKTSSSLIDLTPKLRKDVHDALKPLMEDWCGKMLEPTFVYGVREYHTGAILKMHRDRIDTHIISAIVNVAQDTEVDWPLVIEDNYYRTHKIMIKPGEVILYEGGRLLHGRPISFEGKSFANMFCHFKPTDYVAPT